MARKVGTVCDITMKFEYDMSKHLRFKYMLAVTCKCEILFLTLVAARDKAGSLYIQQRLLWF